MLVRRVVDHQVDEHANPALTAAVREFDEIAERSVARVDAVVIGDVVSVVALRRGLKRRQPNRRDAQTLEIVESP